MQVGLPFLSSKRAEFGVGIAKIEDKYFQKSVIDFGNDKFDKSRYDLFGGSISFNGSTLILNNTPHVDTEKLLLPRSSLEKSDSTQAKEVPLTTIIKTITSWLQLSYMKEKYHNMSEHWVLGWYLKALYASKNFSENYTATMMQAGEFSPTLHSKLTYNEAFRANQFVGAGIRPIYRLNQMFHLRGEFYGFMPIYPIEKNSLNKAYYGKAFSKFEYLGEISVVCQLPFGDISAYVNHYSSPKREWNVGLSIGFTTIQLSVHRIKKFFYCKKSRCKSLLIREKAVSLHPLNKNNGRVAQLNRVADYGSAGYRFESCRDHFKV